MHKNVFSPLDNPKKYSIKNLFILFFKIQKKLSIFCILTYEENVSTNSPVPVIFFVPESFLCF